MVRLVRVPVVVDNQRGVALDVGLLAHRLVRGAVDGSDRHVLVVDQLLRELVPRGGQLLTARELKKGPLNV